MKIKLDDYREYFLNEEYDAEYHERIKRLVKEGETDDY